MRLNDTDDCSIGIVGLVMQNITYTITTPLWLFAHLLTSPVSKPFPGTHANSVLLISSLDLKILPIAITLSYLVPSILMALPSEYVTIEKHQMLLALWQVFPLLTVIIHRILYFATNRLSNYFFPVDPNNRPTIPLGTSYLHNAKHVYRFVLTLCITTHLPILFLTLFPASFLPSFSPLELLIQISSTHAHLPNTIHCLHPQISPAFRKHRHYKLGIRCAQFLAMGHLHRVYSVHSLGDAIVQECHD